MSAYNTDGGSVKKLLDRPIIRVSANAALTAVAVIMTSCSPAGGTGSKPTPNGLTVVGYTGFSTAPTVAVLYQRPDGSLLECIYWQRLQGDVQWAGRQLLGCEALPPPSES